ncbi:adenine deaminase [Levilactobacillus brevis]|uniref:adenine deaminase C-terminal domain-containing protein n=1 Tax=Levilactobacillus brevis TaxID=1580 RepID=UPI000FF360AC|nr:adenine deaminase C-terminal domain-containing protein [Levilactobacillus brevis]RWZ42913.1 adenine deaminase [Levilactobacillus brevis]
MLSTNELGNYIQAGAAEIPADTVIEHGTLVNVMTGEYYPTNVAIYQGRIVAVDQDITDYIGLNTKHIDATNQYLVPGLIDGHIHVECSKMSMTSFSQAVLPHGTTSIISGLDEYISSIGLDGLEEIFAEINQLPLKVFWGTPYKTPYTFPKSTIAYDIDSDDQARLLQQENCFGVWETVREAVQTRDEDTLKTLTLAQKYHQPIFGCSPMARGKALNQFLMSGVRLDHESYSHEEFVEKARKGLHVIIRESTVTKFLKENIRAITEVAPGIARNTSFCTDDVNATDILDHGHVDHMVRLAINAGIAPMTAIQMATINSAEAYRIDDHVGMIAPGKDADILLVDQPGTFNIQSVISKGQLVAQDNQMVVNLAAPKRSSKLQGRLKHQRLQPQDFDYHVDLKNGQANVETIKSVGPFVRKQRDVILDVKDGIVQPDPNKDVALVSVIERYGKNGNQSLGFVSGWSLKQGAVATSASPDDNNLVVLGTNTNDMAIAANQLIEHGGGQIVVVDGKVIDLLELPIGGIATDLVPDKLAQRERDLKQATCELGSKLPDPLFYLSFLPITAIPDLAITDMGNVDCIKLELFDPILKLSEAGQTV